MVGYELVVVKVLGWKIVEVMGDFRLLCWDGCKCGRLEWML